MDSRNGVFLVKSLYSMVELGCSFLFLESIIWTCGSCLKGGFFFFFGVFLGS